MAKYLIEDTTLTNIADAIRAKTGTTDEIKISEMASTIENITNKEIELCEVIISGESANYYPTDICYTTLDDNGNITYKYDTCTTNSITINCLKNSIVAVKFAATLNLSNVIGSSILFSQSPLAIFKIENDISLENVSDHIGGSG